MCEEKWIHEHHCEKAKTMFMIEEEKDDEHEMKLCKGGAQCFAIVSGQNRDKELDSPK